MATIPGSETPKRLLGLKSVIDFGRHKGRTVEEVYKIDSPYIHWALRNIPDFKINRNALLLLPPLKELPDDHYQPEASDFY